MRVSRSMVLWLVAGLVGTAAAQVVPPPLSATLVNFDDVQAPEQPARRMPLTTEYSNLGVTFGGFG